MKQGFAYDQYGCLWIVIERNGDLWAIGYDDEIYIRQIFDGNRVETDLTKPNAFRNLTHQEVETIR